MDRSAEIDAFLARLPEDLRTALETLRGQVAVACPDNVETIAYSVPAFRYKGRPLVSFSAGRNGRGPCALYVQSPEVTEAYGSALRGYHTSTGTIHFTPAQPLPGELVTMLVRARMAETDTKGKQ
ncbi:MAG: iron chaperone [Candidatus Limnocylindrales bacterium]